jgi:hypothetical protein
MRQAKAVAVAVAVFVSVIAASVNAQPGPDSNEAMPFGLKKGMTNAQLGATELSKPGFYKLVQVPKPHPDFEAYIVQVGPTTGLCWVKGVGKNVSTSVYGSELKVAYNDLRDQVGATYGQYEEMDFLRAGSIWDEPKDWTMAMLKKERYLMSTWKTGILKPGLKMVGVNVSVLSRDTGFVNVEYYFDNHPQCEQELKAAKGSVL